MVRGGERVAVHERVGRGRVCVEIDVKIEVNFRVVVVGFHQLARGVELRVRGGARIAPVSVQIVPRFGSEYNIYRNDDYELIISR